MPRGRLKLFREDMIHQSEVLGSFGFDLTKLAQVFGVRLGTLIRYNRQHPELKKALKRGRSILAAKIGDQFAQKIEQDEWEAIKYGLKHIIGWKQQPLVDNEPKVFFIGPKRRPKPKSDFLENGSGNKTVITDKDALTS